MAHPYSIEMHPTGFVHGGRQAGTNDDWGCNRCDLMLRDVQLSKKALAGQDQHSHVEVLCMFHVDADEPVEHSEWRSAMIANY